MRLKTQFPKGKNVRLAVVGVQRVFRHPDGRRMTEAESDAHAQGYIAGTITEERTVLANYGVTTSRHLWAIYCADSRRNRWAIDYSFTERLWNGVEESRL